MEEALAPRGQQHPRPQYPRQRPRQRSKVLVLERPVPRFALAVALAE
jgi:hypothetical protein